MNTFVRLLPCLVVLWVAACREPPVQTPERAYTDFARAIEKGQFQQAYRGLSTPTQALLEERAKKVSAASGGAVRPDPALLAFATAEKPAPLIEVVVLSIDGGFALVAPKTAGGTAQVQLVQEDGGWKVDLTERLKQ